MRAWSWMAASGSSRIHVSSDLYLSETPDLARLSDFKDDLNNRSDVGALRPLATHPAAGWLSPEFSGHSPNCIQHCAIHAERVVADILAKMQSQRTPVQTGGNRVNDVPHDAVQDLAPTGTLR